MARQWFGWLWLLVAGIACAAPVPVELPRHGRIDLSAQPRLIAPVGTLSAGALADGRAPAAPPSPGDPAVLPLSPSVEAWIVVRLRSTANVPTLWRLQYELPSIDEVAVFDRRAKGASPALAGDGVRLSDWPRSARYPTFALEMQPREERVVVVRVRNEFPAPAPIVLVGEEAAIADDAKQTVIFGLVLGALLLLTLTCAVQAALYRNGTYLTYSVYSALLAGAFASLTGVAGRHFWGDLLPWTDVAKTALPLAAAGVSVWLVRDLCGLGVRGRRGAVVSAASALLVLAVAAGCALAGETDPKLSAAAVGVAAATVLVISSTTWLRGDRTGAWVLFAHAPVIAVTVLVVLRMFRIVPFEFDANSLLAIAIGLALPLLLIVLNLRYREQVLLQVRARELANVDALTGLLSPAYFTERLQSAIRRWHRRKQDAAVLYVRVANWQSIREVHGAATAEQSMIRAVMKIQRVVQEADCSGRVDEATIGLLLESGIDRAAIQDRAARLIAHGLMPLPGLDPPVTLRFHVMAHALSDRPMDATELQLALSAALGAMSSRTRRPIRFLVPLPGQSEPHGEEDWTNESRPA